ncbi:PREDICTED: cation/H(+) antiporter 15-like [Lupinus angustifolius]|nr:PREDICTED: cation/H(+) antiporter 15-like [Lupinus angustifolius]
MANSFENGTVSVYHDSSGLLQVCVKNDRSVGSPGMFYGDNPFDYVLPVTLCQIFIHNILSRLFSFLLKPIRTPKFICNVIAGIALGPSGLGLNQKYFNALFPPRQTEFLQISSLIGASYYVFVITLKMDIVTTLRAAKHTWKLGVIPYLSSFGVITVLLGLYYKLEQNPHIQNPGARTFIGISMSFSYFPVISEALMEFNLIATEIGQIALCSSMLNDVLQWVIVAAQRVTAAETVKNSVMFFNIHCIFLFFCVFIVRPLMKMIVRTTPVGKQVKEIYVIVILVGVLVMAGLSDIIGISIFMGPILLGLITPSGPPLGTTLIDKSEVIISRFILPFFYLDIGLNTDLSTLQNWKEVVVFQCILLAGYLAKMIACVLVSISYNIKPKHGVMIGFIMNVKGVNELLAFSRLREHKGLGNLVEPTTKFLDEQTFTHLVMCVVVMTAIVSPFIKLLYMHRPRTQHPSINSNFAVRSIQNTPSDTEFRIITCLHHEASVRGMIALLEACNPILESPICAYVIHLVEIMGQSAPILLPINYKQNKKIMSVNYPNTNHIMRAFENYSNNASGPITILPYVNIAHYKHMHEAICNLAQDKIVPLIIIPFHENDHVDLGGHVAKSIQKLNTRFQSRAVCTVGILVDRDSKLGGDDSMMIFHVGIFFIGGQDDREALALGIRMANRENVRVSLFRFVVTNINDKDDYNGRFKSREEEEEEEIEEMLNESLIDEFKSMKFGSGNVSWYEIMVADGEEILDTIRKLEGNYDLVMVGRRHNIGNLNDEELTTFIENAETLGIFGDMLASTEFCIGMVPVLVTQCGGNLDTEHKFSRVGSATVSQKSLDI